MTILLSPWSAITQEKKPSPKNYPHWGAVVEGLRKAGHEVLQVSRSGEPDIAAAGIRRVNDLPLKRIAEMIRSCSTWVSVDNFWHHMAWTLGEPGVVIFGLSDPEIFGHPGNLNLLKSRAYLREQQFWLWSQVAPNPAAFVDPHVVVGAALLSVEKRSKRLLLKERGPWATNPSGQGIRLP